MTKNEMIAELRGDAQWIGEDGNMATISSSQLGAFRKFKKEIEAVGGDMEDLTADDVQIAWAYLTTEKDKEEMEDCEWYVSYKQPEIDGVKGVEVWVLNI